MTTLPIISEHDDPVPPNQRGFAPYQAPAAAPLLPPAEPEVLQVTFTREQFRRWQRAVSERKHIIKENKLLAVNNRAYSAYAHTLENDLTSALSELASIERRLASTLSQVALLEGRSQAAESKAMAAEDTDAVVG